MDGVGLGGFGGRDMTPMGRMGGKSLSHVCAHHISESLLHLLMCVFRYVQVWYGDDGP